MQSIHNIEIKNFKSIRHSEIKDCRRVNVFIGYPNVGKSNILEALGLYSFAQFYNNENFLIESICRFNHFSDINFDKDVRNEVRIGLNKEYELYLRKGATNEIGEDYDPGAQDYIFEIGCFSSKEIPLFQINSYKGINKKFISPADKPFRDDVIIGKIKYYCFNSRAEYDKTKSGSLSIPDGDNLLDILQGNINIRKLYAELLKDYNLKLNISDNDIAVAKELSDGTFVSFPNNLVSDTLRRLFFYKTAIATNENSVLLFEEPEAHMFPPYIAKLTTDILFDKNNNQYFISTHSPYVLDELIEEAEDDLAVYVVDYDKGETIIKRLTDEQVLEVAQYGIDLFFNLESYLDKNG